MNFSLLAEIAEVLFCPGDGERRRKGFIRLEAGGSSVDIEWEVLSEGAGDILLWGRIQAVGPSGVKVFGFARKERNLGDFLQMLLEAASQALASNQAEDSKRALDLELDEILKAKFKQGEINWQ